MANCKIDLTNCDERVIARTLRRQAQYYDPWTPCRHAAIAFLFGCAFMAAMDYGDLWICAGECGSLRAAQQPTQEG